MTTEPSVAELMDHARRTQAALTAERVQLAERRASYELRARMAQPEPVEQPAPELPEGMGAVTWVMITAVFALGFALVFICGPWSVVAPSPWTVGGTVGGGVLMVLGTAAAGRMARRR